MQRTFTIRAVAAIAATFTSLVIACPAIGAEPLVVDLWPGQAPDESGGIGPERIRMSPKLDRKQVEVTEPTQMITDVTKPTHHDLSAGEGQGHRNRDADLSRAAATGTSTGNWKARKSRPG